MLVESMVVEHQSNFMLHMFLFLFRRMNFYFEVANSRNAYGHCKEQMKVVIEDIPCQSQHNQGMQAELVVFATNNQLTWSFSSTLHIHEHVRLGNGLFQYFFHAWQRGNPKSWRQCHRQELQGQFSEMEMNAVGVPDSLKSSMDSQCLPCLS